MCSIKLTVNRLWAGVEQQPSSTVLHVRGHGRWVPTGVQRERNAKRRDGKPLLKCSKWPWVSIAPGCFERAVGKRGAYHPGRVPAHPHTPAKPPFYGREGITRIRNDSARCRRTKTHGGWSAYGLPMVRAITWSNASSAKMPSQVFRGREADESLEWGLHNVSRLIYRFCRILLSLMFFFFRSGMIRCAEVHSYVIKRICHCTRNFRQGFF